MTAPILLGLLGILAAVGALGCALLFIRLRRMQRALDQAGATLGASTQSQYFHALVADSASDGLVVMDMNGIILWANQAYCEMQGHPLNDMLGRNPLSFCMLPDLRPSDEEIANFRYDQTAPEYTQLSVWQNIRADGSLFWNQISVSFRDAPGGEKLAVLVCRDVSEQVENEAKLRETTVQLEQAATHDSLTGIANRAAMIDSCNRFLHEAAEQGTRIGLLHIDVDFFKEINDRVGHSAGDAVLMHVARTLQSLCGPDDVAARIGGDEFVVVCRDLAGLDALAASGQAIIDAINQPVHWQHHQLRCNVSIGAALSQPGMRDPEELLSRSDFALYEVKRTGRGQLATYSEALHERHLTHTRRSAELSEAVKSGGLEFFFQPVVIWPRRQLLGFETLVRWRHPTEGMLPPAEFLGMAQDMGLMAEIDLAAMRAAVDMKVALRDAGLRNKVLSFNAGAEGLLHPDYVTILQSLTDQHDIPPGHLTVEVLETIMFDDQMSMSAHSQVISTLAAQGYKTVLDDFGIGHAGLAHLTELSLTGVKIDRSLISRIATDKASARIVSTVLDLCSDLGLDVIAEGVETDTVAAALQDIGCHILQGYGIARPMPAAEVIGWALAYQDAARTSTPPQPAARIA